MLIAPLMLCDSQSVAAVNSFTVAPSFRPIRSTIAAGVPLSAVAAIFAVKHAVTERMQGRESGVKWVTHEQASVVSSK